MIWLGPAFLLLRVLLSPQGVGGAEGPADALVELRLPPGAEEWGSPIPKPAVNLPEYVDWHSLLALNAAVPEPAPDAEPEPARLTVRSNVYGDQVYIDGEPRGPTRLDLDLPAGTYRVRVEKDGYTRFERMVTLRAGAAETLVARLERGSSKPGRNLEPGDIFRDCASCPEMVVIPAGELQMGSPDTEHDQMGAEGPVHQVRIDRPFALATHEVTVAEFRAFVEAEGYRTQAECDTRCYGLNGADQQSDSKVGWRSPGFEQGDDHPVVCVSWNDAQAYVRWLSDKTGAEYRLPSEAEWEYAARAGTETPFWTGDCIDTDQANYDGNYDYAGCGAKTGVLREGTVPAASLPANPVGLHENAGNVWEWVEDCWHDDYTGAPAGGSAWLEGEGGRCDQRVLRGGSWSVSPSNIRSANRIRNNRDGSYYDVGFRLARTL